MFQSHFAIIFMPKLWVFNLTKCTFMTNDNSVDRDFFSECANDKFVVFLHVFRCIVKREVDNIDSQKNICDLLDVIRDIYFFHP